MIILTSPAKTLNFESKIPKREVTHPTFEKEANQIAENLAKLSIPQLAKKLVVSKKLAEINFIRYQDWDTNPKRPALFAYYGDIFRQMNPKNYSEQEIEYAQKSLRIISGLYGIVRPLDEIKPYRLEMKRKVKINKKSNLYDFWREKLTHQLNEEIKNENHTFILNLASSEYSKAIDFKKLSVPVITVDFKQNLRGKIQNYGLLSKRARGMMIEFCIKNRIETQEEIQRFTTEKYNFKKETKSGIFFTQP